eukprot:6203189-Pleurochrysis_carterae.AAC.2
MHLHNQRVDLGVEPNLRRCSAKGSQEQAKRTCMHQWCLVHWRVIHGSNWAEETRGVMGWRLIPLCFHNKQLGLYMACGFPGGAPYRACRSSMGFYEPSSASTAPTCLSFPSVVVLRCLSGCSLYHLQAARPDRFSVTGANAAVGRSTGATIMR